jgi:hypothetical protein
MADVTMSHKERLVRLREEIQDSFEMDIADRNLWKQQMEQLLHACEAMKVKSQKEIENLTRLIGVQQGEMKAADRMADLLINTIAAYNRQNRNVQEEEKRRSEERREAERAAAEAKAKEEAAKSNGSKAAPAKRRRTTKKPR